MDTELLPTKTCTKCGETKPATTEYFSPKKRCKYGLSAECKSCGAARSRGYYAANKEKKREYFREYREANKEKRREYFRGYSAANREKKREYFREYREANKEKISEQRREYYKANKEKISEYEREYRETNKEKISERRREYYEANLERVREENRERHQKWCEANKEKVRGRKREYREANLEKVRESSRNYRQTSRGKEMQRIGKQRRRARQRALPATFTAQDWQYALEYFGGCCAYCGRPQGLWHTLAQEHYQPVSKGGAFVPTNIIPACHGEGGCNNSKSNRDPHEWAMDVLAKKLGTRRAKEALARIEAYFATLASPLQEN